MISNESCTKFAHYINNIDNNIVPLLIQSGGIISGSCALKFLGNFNFNTDNIDIYVTNTRGRQEFCEWLSNVSHSGIKVVKYQVVSSNYIDDIQTCYFGEIKINIILLSKNIIDPCDYVNNYFDFDFCKVIFTGDIFKTIFLDNILSKSCLLSSIPLSPIIYDQMPELSLLVQYENDIRHKIYRRFDPLGTLDRIFKYEKRGFNIDTSKFNFDEDEIKNYAVFFFNNYIKNQLNIITKIQIHNNNKYNEDNYLMYCNFLRKNNFVLLHKKTKGNENNADKFLRCCLLYNAELYEEQSNEILSCQDNYSYDSDNYDEIDMP